MNGISKYGKILSVFLLLPTVLLAIYIATVANDEIDVGDVLAVSISDGRYKHRYSGKEDIEEYVSLVVTSKNDALQETDENAVSLKIEFEMKNGGTKTYDFYPSLRGDSLIKDGTGMLRTVKDVSDLLTRVEYENLYSPRYLPDLWISAADGSVSLLPAEYAWSFKKTDGEFYVYNKTETTEACPSYRVSAEALKKGIVSFSIAPTELVVAYTVGGNTYGKVENLSLKDGEQVEITISALWEKRDDGMFFGEGKWKFTAIYKDSPIITLDKTSGVLGDCFVLYSENIDVGEVISLETELDTNKSPLVYKGENKSFALVPVGVETPEGEYSLKVSYRESSFEFKVKVTAVSNGFAIKNVNAEVYNAVTSPSGLEEHERFISSLVSKTALSFLWSNQKLQPAVEGEAELVYASEVLYNGLPPQVYYEGESYPVPQKTSVKSSAKGKVVFAGETKKTGKTVVIDHGCGIMTHYYHLSVISAVENEEIDEGKLIGLSGKSGYTDKEELQFAVSVNGVFVNPAMFK